MSAIYFHTQHGEDVRLSGSERAMMGSLINRIFWGILNPDSWHSDIPNWKRLLAPGHYLHKTNENMFFNSLKTAVSVDFGESLFVYDGKPIPLFESALNTAMLVGSPAVQLAARLHGQSEIHAYIEGPNRSMIADIMEEGLDAGIFRRKLREYDQGWSAVIELLRNNDTEPVVTSYSVCDSFPNYGVANFELPMIKPEGCDEEEEDYSAWEDLPHEEKWELGMAGIRSTQGLEILADPCQLFYREGQEPIDAFKILGYVDALEEAAK